MGTTGMQSVVLPLFWLFSAPRGASCRRGAGPASFWDYAAPGSGAEGGSAGASGRRHVMRVPWRGALTSSTSPSTLDTDRSEEHTSELQSRENLVCRLLLEKKKL